MCALHTASVRNQIHVNATKILMELGVKISIALVYPIIPLWSAQEKESVSQMILANALTDIQVQIVATGDALEFQRINQILSVQETEIVCRTTNVHAKQMLQEQIAAFVPYHSENLLSVRCVLMETTERTVQIPFLEI